MSLSLLDELHECISESDKLLNELEDAHQKSKMCLGGDMLNSFEDTLACAISQVRIIKRDFQELL